jgi:hypothetical protein
VRSYFSFSNFVLWKEFELPLLKFSKVLVVLNHNQSNTYMYTHTQRHISMYEFIYVYSPHLHTYTGKRCKILVSTLMSNLSSLHSSVTSLNWLQVTLPTWEAMELKNHITPFFFVEKSCEMHMELKSHKKLLPKACQRQSSGTIYRTAVNL